MKAAEILVVWPSVIHFSSYTDPVLYPSHLMHSSWISFIILIILFVSLLCWLFSFQYSIPSLLVHFFIWLEYNAIVQYLLERMMIWGKVCDSLNDQKYISHTLSGDLAGYRILDWKQFCFRILEILLHCVLWFCYCCLELWSHSDTFLHIQCFFPLLELNESSCS